MKWIKRKLAKWVDQGFRYNEDGNKSEQLDPPRNGFNTRVKPLTHSDDVYFQNPLSITLYNAMGGRIIKFSHYDRKSDHETVTTYVVPDSENFEEALGKFIAIESLKL